jgi:GGDEF domain-containing protein
MGHEAGDAALRTFADRIRASIRKSDVFARIGGDEFVIFMRVKDQDSARIVANRLDQAINVGSTDRADHLQCSFGVLFLANGSAAIDAELRLADKLLYSSKKARCGFLLASANGGVDLTTDISALEIALPVNRKSVIRQAEGIRARGRGCGDAVQTARSHGVASVM